MTFAYKCFYVSWWSLAVLAIPGAVVCAVLGFTLGGAAAVALYAAAAAQLAFAIFLRLHSQRVMIRAGVFPGLCSDDLAMRPAATREESVEKIKKYCNDIKDRYNRAPQLVGGGWGYFLKRGGPPGPRLLLHNFKGQVDDGPCFYSGTTIFAVNKYFQKQKPPRTLANTPTMQFISIGSWLALGNHGNAGDKAAPVEAVIRSVGVLDMDTMEFFELEGSEVRARFDAVGGASLCVVDVTFKDVPLDKMIQKRGYTIDSPVTAAKWLLPGAYLRVCFMGGSRRFSVGLRWEDIYSDTKHVDPHFCSQFCQFLQVDVCSILGGFIEPMTMFDGKSTLSDANSWVPYIDPLMAIAAIAYGVINFECVFKVRGLNGVALWALIRNMVALHRKHGGRSEVRVAGTGADSFVYLDIVLNPRHFDRVFLTLSHAFGVKRLALHPGKFTEILTHPIQRVTLHQVFEDTQPPVVGGGAEP